MAKKMDARVERTRAALGGAFTSLFFERPYDRITVDAIARRARVGRSTFYEHFTDKEDVLAATLRAPLTALAACVEHVAPPLSAVLVALEHFAEHGDQARRLLSSSSRAAVARVLGAMIEERLEARNAGSSAAEQKLTALAIAHAQLGSISGWLRGETGASAAETARVIHRITRAAAR